MACKFQQITAKIEAQDKECKQELQEESQGHGLHSNRAPVAGKQIGQPQHRDQAQKSCQTAHSPLPIMRVESLVALESGLARLTLLRSDRRWTIIPGLPFLK